jgi:hypothetical protein
LDLRKAVAFRSLSQRGGLPFYGLNAMPLRDYQTKPKGDEIRIRLDSGANIQSENWEIVLPPDLGFDTKADWDAASEDEKLKAVQEYFYGNGYPDWSWDDESTAK